jgi:hypothetical protein
VPKYHRLRWIALNEDRVPKTEIEMMGEKAELIYTYVGNLAMAKCIFS